MNRRQEKYQDQERRLLLIAARYAEFTLGQLWEENRWFRYSRMSITLLCWWRDGLLLRLDKDGQWRTWEEVLRLKIWGPGKLPHFATYKWVE